MPDMIHVEPEPSRRRDFAAWAVAQEPKVRTVSATAFAIPADLFTEAPERLLIGSQVDGHRYVSPEEGESEPEASAGAELTGVARPEGFMEGSPSMPEAPEETTAPGAQLLAAIEHDADVETDSLPDPESGEPVCADCSRGFKSERGLATHRRQVHHKE
ncbi:hypothetical protein [Streptomyces kronopolitis]|uniref:hypothetical protein n=1 Tax=Streptomyces kronopolitis TaxID=1612435 RepID=UPI00343455D4